MLNRLQRIALIIVTLQVHHIVPIFGWGCFGGCSYQGSSSDSSDSTDVEEVLEPRSSSNARVIDIEARDVTINNLRCISRSDIGKVATWTSNEIYYGGTERRVGSLTAFCVCADIVNRSLECQHTLSVEEDSENEDGVGIITMRGVMSENDDTWNLAIVGTTGDFIDTKGEAVLKDDTYARRRTRETDRDLQIEFGDRTSLYFIYTIELM
eukprot:CAMPEP_0194355088 /NCGR_PEP_ID=MMETSP0174-20130528/3068_1 /TAXON_ID=216777 /ORGANISM="Proboscia alata, Strain PI-D3" /LENGTH=209 /DNA_ID=CAMNT_0039124239 /DNA_START=84 /DNA_END=713 /DNA_ORIENTATION=+